MKILFITSNALTHATAPGNHALELIEALREEGCAVDVVARGGETENLYAVPTVNFPWVGTLITEFLLFLTAWRQARLRRHDLIYFRIEATSCFVYLLRELTRIPMFVEVNGWIEDELKINNMPRRLYAIARFTERKTYGVADRVLPVTATIARLLEAERRVPPSKIRVVPNAVNLRRFHPRSAGPSDNTPFVVGYVGSIAPWQGVEVLIDAISFARKAGMELTCQIVGDGKTRGELERRAAELGVDDLVSFKGAIPYECLAETMEPMSVGVIPKRQMSYGWMPMKLFQFLAMGIPVIVSDVPEINQWTRDHHVGLVFNPDDPRHLAECLIRMAGDSMLRNACREKCLEIAAHHSWNNAARSILAERDALPSVR